MAVASSALHFAGKVGVVTGAASGPGRATAPAAWRAELRGVIDFGFRVMWNIERAAR